MELALGVQLKGVQERRLGGGDCDGEAAETETTVATARPPQRQRQQQRRRGRRRDRDRDSDSDSDGEAARVYTRPLGPDGTEVCCGGGGSGDRVQKAKSELRAEGRRHC